MEVKRNPERTNFSPRKKALPVYRVTIILLEFSGYNVKVLCHASYSFHKISSTNCSLKVHKLLDVALHEDTTINLNLVVDV